jgi:hypothetical protein
VRSEIVGWLNVEKRCVCQLFGQRHDKIDGDLLIAYIAQKKYENPLNAELITCQYASFSCVISRQVDVHARFLLRGAER